MQKKDGSIPNVSKKMTTFEVGGVLQEKETKILKDRKISAKCRQENWSVFELNLIDTDGKQGLLGEIYEYGKLLIRKEDNYYFMKACCFVNGHVLNRLNTKYNQRSEAVSGVHLSVIWISVPFFADDGMEKENVCHCVHL